MLDPGRALAEAIYFIQYVLAQLFWSLDRALLSMAVIAEDVNTWLTTNVAFLVDLLTNALAGPMGALFVFALTLLGVWYLLNSITPTKRVVDPQKLLLYGFMTFFFFSTPVMVIEMVEGLRQAATAGVQASALADAEGELFGTAFDGTDTGLPAAMPDVYPAGDGVIGSFDLVAYFLSIGNVAELGNTEFPALFTAAYFPYGDPSAINLADEADQEAAKRLAAEGLERLLFALIAIPTAIADHVLRLSLTGAAALLYAGIPFAMMLAFFVHTEAFIGAYLRQFINLFIETFLSVIIASLTIGLLAIAAQRGIGLYIGAAIIAVVILTWRIQGAFKLAMAGAHLFGGGVVTGGATGTDLVNMGRNAAVTGAGAGLALAAGGGALAAAGMLKADAKAGGGYLNTDPEKADGRVRQLETMAGYAVGKSPMARNMIETVHEVRTFGRNFRDGEPQYQEPDLMDYLRVGSSMSSFGSSPWVAMKLSPSLRDAYGQIGGYGRRPYGPAAGQGRWRNDEWGSGGMGNAPAQRTDGAGDTPTRPSGNSTANAAPPVNHEGSAATPPTGNTADATTTRQPTPVPRIHLAPLTANRQAGLASLAANLDGPAATQTQRVLVDVVGPERAGALQTAVTEHGAAAVQAAVDAVVAQVAAAQAAGQSAQDIVASFQRGETLPDSPLNREQLTAVTDVVLQPRREMSQADLVGAMAANLAAGGRSDADLAAVVGNPSHFGPQTGAIRAVLEGIERLQLTAQDLERIAARLQSGQAIAPYLTGQGYTTTQAQAFSRDLDGLVGGLSIPQTTAVPPAAPQPTAPTSTTPPTTLLRRSPEPPIEGDTP